MKHRRWIELVPWRLTDTWNVDMQLAPRGRDARPSRALTEEATPPAICVFFRFVVRVLMLILWR